MPRENEYVESGHDHAISAFFDDRSKASDAMERLVAAGIPRDHVSMADRDDGLRQESSRKEHGGFGHKMAHFFFPEEDREAYAEGLRRGGYLITAETDGGHYEAALDILDDEGAVDMQLREESWRAEGWHGRDGQTERRDGDGAIPITEEHLNVGKRDISHGRVRVRSYIVEEPVNEDVNLHSEHVDVQRKPVDRPVTEKDALFRDRTIEAEEHGEEPVVSKDARVKEEVSLSKKGEDRKETISDKVRHTEVDIDDERNARTKGK